MKRIAIVTGASSGLGRQFARQLPEHYSLDEVWLLARNRAALTETARGIPGARPVRCDLTSADDIDRVKRMLRTERPVVEVLVNAAGFGRDASFKDTPLEVSLEMIDLNVRALVALTGICLPYLNKEGVIFQVASLNAFLPLPGGAVYGATKAFVLSFGQALYAELKKQGTHVITVCPGAMKTDFFRVISEGQSGIPAGAADPDAVVRQAINDARAGQINSTYGLRHRATIVASRLINRRRYLIRQGEAL